VAEQEQAAMMEELRAWQALVSLWDRMEDRKLVMHEAPSTFEISNPAREGWLMRRSKSGVFAEWLRQWAVLKRAHLFLYDRPDSPRPSNWYLLRKADIKVRGETSGQKHVLEIMLPHHRKVVLAVATLEDRDGWQDKIFCSIALGTSDARACRPLRCAPAIVKQRALGGVPDCFRGIVWQKLTGADTLRQRHPDRFQQCHPTLTADASHRCDMPRCQRSTCSPLMTCVCWKCGLQIQVAAQHCHAGRRVHSTRLAPYNAQERIF